MVLFRRETAKRVLAATEWVETQRGTPPPADRTPTRAARGYDRVYGRVQLVQSSSGEGADTIYLTDVMATRGALPDLDNEGRLEVQNPFGWKVLEGDWVGAEWQQDENTWAIYEIGTPFVHVSLTEPLYECASAEGIPADYSGEPITVYDDYGRVARDPVARRDEESGQWYAPEGTAVLVRWLEDKQHFTVFFLSKCDQNSSSSEEECPDRYSGTLDVLIPEPYRSGDYLCFPTKRLEFDCGILISVEDGDPVCEYVCCDSFSSSEPVNCTACDGGLGPPALKVTISGLANGSCNDCASLNGEYIIISGGGTSGCTYQNGWETPCGTLSINATLEFVPMFNLHIYIGTQVIEVYKNVGTTDCLHFDQTFTAADFSGSLTACNWSNIQVRVQAYGV